MPKKDVPVALVLNQFPVHEAYAKRKSIRINGITFRAPKRNVPFVYYDWNSLLRYPGIAKDIFYLDLPKYKSLIQVITNQGTYYVIHVRK